MRSTKLLETLRSLSTRERSRFRAFLESDYFNKNGEIRGLYTLLLGHAPEFDQKDIDYRVIFTTLHGKDTAYSAGFMHNLSSDLYERLLDFLAWEHRASDLPEAAWSKVIALLERNLDRHAEAELDKFRKLLDKLPLRNAEWYRWDMRYWEAGEMLQSRRPRREAGNHLQGQAEAIYAAHMLENLRLHVAARSRGALAVLKAEDHPRWLTRLEIPEGEQEPRIAIQAAEAYFAALSLLRAPAPEAYEKLHNALLQHGMTLHREELSALYQCALNYCIRRINEGRPDAYAQALELYRELMERNLLVQQGRLSQWTYKNIATAGLRNGAFEWTSQFLYRYIDELPAAERENALAFNLANLYFEKQAYDSALKTLQNVEFSDITYQLGAKILLLKIFYLLGESEALYSLLHATRQLLHRNRSLSSFGKNANLNFLKALGQMQRLQDKKNVWPKVKYRQHLRKFTAELSVLHPLANKDWLQRIAEGFGG